MTALQAIDKGRVIIIDGFSDDLLAVHQESQDAVLKQADLIRALDAERDERETLVRAQAVTLMAVWNYFDLKDDPNAPRSKVNQAHEKARRAMRIWRERV